MSFLDRLFRGRGTAAEAKRSELRGDLPRAIELWALAGEPDEAARLMVLRGDSETEARLRLQYYAQAAATAREGGPIQKAARIKRASLRLALASDGAIAATTRRDLLEAAKELENLGEADRAGEAYLLLKDIEGQARALVQGGHVEQLESLLDAEQSKTDLERKRGQDHSELETLILTGRRREALAAARRLALSAQDPSAREKLEALSARRVGAGVCRVILGERPLNLLIDDEVVIGRTEGSLIIRSAALSRKHLAIARNGVASFVVRDLGSRNGTLLRGMRIAGPLPLGEGLELELGGEVRVKLAPGAALPETLDLDVGGERYVASLGPLPLGIGGWHLERAADGWVELVTDEQAPAYRSDLAMAPRVTLLVGDKFAATRGGEAVLEVLGMG
jgi:hypothetical protein